MSAAETTREPRTLVVVYGSDQLAASIVAVWIASGCGIESRRVNGTWEHRAYAPRVEPLKPEPHDEMVSTDPHTTHVWFVWKWVDNTHRELVGTEPHTDADLEALAAKHSPNACLEYRRENPWHARRRHLKRVDLHSEGVVFERLDDVEETR